MRRPLRILHVDTEHGWRAAEAQLLTLARGLAALGDGNVVACPPGSSLEERARAAGLQTLPVVMRGELDLAAATTLRRFVSRHQVHLLHAHTPRAQALIAVAGRGGLARRVVTRRVDESRHRRRFAWTGLSPRLPVELHVANSLAAERTLLDGGIDRRRLAMIPAGVDLDVGPPSSGRDNGYRREPVAATVATFSTLAPERGLALFIDAAAELRRARADVRLVVHGEGDERQFLEAQIARLGLQESVELPGDDGRRTATLRKLAVYVAPGNGADFDHSLAQAMLVGCPIVATDAGSHSELVRHERTGLLVPPGDPVALADAVARLLDDDDLAAKLGRAGRVAVRRGHAPETMVQGYRQAYSELVEGRMAVAT